MVDSDYWLSTKSPVHLFRAAYNSVEMDKYIRATRDIDPAILSTEIGLSVPRIQAYRRQLGVRAISNHRNKT